MAWFQGLFGRRRAAGAPAATATAPRFYMFGGRRHMRAPYVLPKDTNEVKRLDFQHFVLRYRLHRNFLAPVTQPLSILDVGCGTGRWAMELATEFPEANVVGLDLVAVEEVTLGYGLDRLPSNYVFVAGDALQPLPFADNSFEFVHQRLLIAAVPVGRWPDIIRELARVTVPGGWIELAECGVPRDAPGMPYPDLWGTWIEFCRQRGIDFTMGHTLGALLHDAGLTAVRQQEVVFPMGDHGGSIGRMSATDCLAMGRTMRPAVISKGITSEAQYDRLIAATEDEFRQKTGKSVLPFYIAYGQKPR